MFFAVDAGVHGTGWNIHDIYRYCTEQNYTQCVVFRHDTTTSPMTKDSTLTKMIQNGTQSVVE